MKQATKNWLYVVLGAVSMLMGQQAGTMLPGVERPGIQEIQEQIEQVPTRLQRVESVSTWTEGGYSLWVDTVTGRYVVVFNSGAAAVLPDPEMPEPLDNLLKP